jgi:hypothetical protein
MRGYGRLAGDGEWVLVRLEEEEEAGSVRRSRYI